MQASRLTWPQDRRLFRRSRSLARALPGAALLAFAGWLIWSVLR